MTEVLADRYPDLIPDPQTWLAWRADLEPAYLDYTEHVSPAEMAIALETAIYIACLCDLRHASRVVDFGSGFTSYVLRYYAAKAAHDVTVVSVDDSERWLTWTARFLDDIGVGSDGLVHTDQYEPAEFDLVVYDYAGGTTRDARIGFAYEQVAPGGLIVFDDAHHERHRAVMSSEGERLGFDVYVLGDWTLDQRGRYAALGIRTQRGRDWFA